MPKALSAPKPRQSLREHRSARELKCWNAFPNISAKAAYFGLSQHIELYDIDAPTMEAAFKADDVMRKLSVFPTILHEVRHWLDHLCTLWGQQSLVATFNAMHSRLADDESQFWHIIEYRRATQRDRFESYFTTINDRTPPTTGNLIWKRAFSCGFGFDEHGRLNERRPIVFTRFQWEDERLACRVPFSVASLLESNAVNYDIQMEQSLLSALPPGVQSVETLERDREHFRRLYDPELAVYSVAAHLVAIQFGLTDMTRTYMLTSYLASLSLNLPDLWFSRLKIPNDFEPWGTRTKTLIDARDRGFAFLVLTTNAPPLRLEQPLKHWLDAVLEASNLPSMAQLEIDALDQMHQIGASALAGIRGSILEDMLATGRHLFTQLGPTLPLEGFLTKFPTLELPPFILSDLNMAFPGRQTGKRNPAMVEGWIIETQQLQRRFEEFAAACGI